VLLSIPHFEQRIAASPKRERVAFLYHHRRATREQGKQASGAVGEAASASGNPEMHRTKNWILTDFGERGAA
jgi:hypothetical protein